MSMLPDMLPDEVHAPAFATLLRRTEPAIVASAVTRLPAAHRSIAAKLLIARFVRCCAMCAAASDWGFATFWLRSNAERYCEILDLFAIVTVAIDAVAESLATGDSRSHAAFEQMRAEFTKLAALPRVVAGGDAIEAVDEIDVALDSLLSELDEVDLLSAEHSRAVASWCSRLAQKLNCSRAETIHLTRGGLIHDIGKVKTPKEILLAARRLDDEEFAIMQQHAVVGGEMVLAIPLIANLAPAVRNHHERFDGKGYPDRLAGEAIPRAARIVAVADSFNAMIGRRLYRPAMSPANALDELVRARGTQFDPDVIDAMIEVVTNR